MSAEESLQIAIHREGWLVALLQTCHVVWLLEAKWGNGFYCRYPRSIAARDLPAVIDDARL
jgi:hypothetical protein